MSITVYEALQLEICKNFKIIAGINGLSNLIKRVGILDHETGEMVYETFTEGQFVLTTLYVIKDDIQKLKELVNMMISVGVCGLAIRSVYFENIPDDVIKLANDNAFPIMLYNNVYFEDVFAGLLTAMKEKDELKMLELRIDSLLYGNPDKELIRKIAYEFNKDFKDRHIVCYCRLRSNELHLNNNIFDLSLEDNFSSLIPYKNGIIIISTFEKATDEQINSIIMHQLTRRFPNTKKYVIGISSIHDCLDELKSSVQESMFALKHSIIYELDYSKFAVIGSDKLFLPLVDNEWVQKFYNELITPIKLYDDKNSTELLTTAITFVKNNGSIKATGAELHQHENTIRYRIERINSLLYGDYNNVHFYEELSIAIRIHNILTSNL